jgi:signal transduction histidine kinase
VLAACDRLEWAMRSLLELATEERARDTSQATAVRPAFEEAVLELEEALAARELALATDIPAASMLPATRHVLHIVLGNVLGNVCAHSASGTVRVWWHDEVLHVANPVDPDALPNVERLGVAGVRREQSPGHGFGLELSRRLCERRGLSLEWRVEGSEFRVRLAAAGRAARTT